MVKAIEDVTNHDVKAVEYFLRDKVKLQRARTRARTRARIASLECICCAQLNGMDQLAGYLHFACTSEDINNLAYARMVQESMYVRNVALVLGLQKHAAVRVLCFFFIFKEQAAETSHADLVMTVAAMVQTTAATPMLALTHGQPATPTTLGKELANFAYVGFEL